METKNSDANIRQIDEHILWVQFSRHFVLLITIVLAFVLSGIIYTEISYKTHYSSRATLLVHDKETGTSTSEISTSTYLAYDYMQIIQSRNVLQKVINNLGLKDYSVKKLQKCIGFETPEKTRIIFLTVTTTDKEMSQKIAEEICEVSKERIADIMNTQTTADGGVIEEASRLIVVDGAGAPNRVVSPMKRNIIIFLILGVIGAIGVLFIFYVTDDKINGEEDISTYLHIGTLAEIPYSDSKKYRAARNTDK